jgi:DNA mismatch endonuclease (patch repair protein)
MRRIRRRDTEPELLLRRSIFSAGGRYRVDDAGVIGRPDVCFRGRRVAVFVDSAFWHGKVSKTRLDAMAPYWQEKLRRNRARDLLVNRQLVKQGWTVVRIDEQAALHKSDATASRIVRIVQRRNKPRIIFVNANGH